MSSFDIQGGEQDVRSCENCIFISTKKHFAEGDDGLQCPNCHSNVKKL